MNYGMAAIGGIVAGLVGAAIWAAIGYYMNAEVGYVAWGIGLLVGVAVAKFTKGVTDGMTGGIAAVCAIGGVVLGKYLVVHFLVANVMPVEHFAVDEEVMVNKLAWDVAEEREAQGKLAVVNGKPTKVEEIDEVEHLPKEIHDEAQKRWSAVSADEQRRQMAEHETQVNEAMAGFMDEARNEGFMNSFGAFDLLWMFLAVGTAFKIGSGGTD